MAKAASYIKDIRAQVRADHGGKVPEFLALTIRNYATALEMRDAFKEKIIAEGVMIMEKGSMGQNVRRQHPLIPALYQYETLVQKYAKDLGGTAAKAAAKTEAPQGVDADDPMVEFYKGNRK